MQVIYHLLIQKDIRGALSFYDAEGGQTLGDRFFLTLEAAISIVLQDPTRFHFVAEGLRRVQLESFPFHVIYEVVNGHLRFLVLRHDKRHPRFGLGRR
jgi:hypothetical protein